MNRKANDITSLANFLRPFVQQLGDLKAPRAELREIYQANPKRYMELLGDIGSLAELYTLPLASILSKIIEIGELESQIKIVPPSADSPSLSIEVNLDNYSGKDDFTEAEQSTLFQLFHVLSSNLDALALYGTTLSELVNASTDDQSIFRAVSIDKRVRHCAGIAARIELAHVENDANFLKHLDKADKRTKPRRPSAKYDSLRAVAAQVTLLEQAGVINTMTDEENYQLFVVELELYPADGEDPYSGLRYLLNKLR